MRWTSQKCICGTVTALKGFWGEFHVCFGWGCGHLIWKSPNPCSDCFYLFVWHYFNLLALAVGFLNIKWLWNSERRLHPLQQSLKVHHFSEWRHTCKISRRPKAERYSFMTNDPIKVHLILTGCETLLKPRDEMKLRKM